MTVRHILAVAALTLGLASPALAFDMPPPVDAPEITSFSNASGWYIRGDLGYNAAVSSDAPETRNIFTTPSRDSFDNHRFSKDFTLNGGMGYQFNDFLRSDMTVDYFSATLKGKQPFQACGRDLAGETAFCQYKEQNVSSLGLLANAYVDLGTYWGLTPYLGAGAGVSYVKWGKVKENIVCTDCDGFTSAELTHKGADSWRFTYALMTGVSYDIATNMKLDFGYRFSQVAGGNMFDFNSNEQFNGAFGMKGKDDGFGRHEFRTGLRVTGW